MTLEHMQSHLLLRIANIFAAIYAARFFANARGNGRVHGTIGTSKSKHLYIYIYIRHSAFSGEACQFPFSTLVVLYTCLGLLSTSPWGPWVLGICSGSALALKLVMEVVVLSPPHPALMLLAVTHNYSHPFKSGKKQHCKKGNQTCTKSAKRLSN